MCVYVSAMAIMWVSVHGCRYVIIFMEGLTVADTFVVLRQMHIRQVFMCPWHSLLFMALEPVSSCGVCICICMYMCVNSEVDMYA